MAFLLGKSSKPVSRCRALICLLAFKQILFTWSSNVKFSWMQIPRVVIDFKNVICWPWIIILKSLACLLPFSNKPWNLAGFASMALSENHCIVTSASVCNCRVKLFNSQYRSEIWQAPRWWCCRPSCVMLERLETFEPESRGFETSRELAVRRPPAKWIEALVAWYA